MVEGTDSSPRMGKEITERVNVKEKAPIEGLAIGAKVDPEDEETRTNT